MFILVHTYQIMHLFASLCVSRNSELINSGPPAGSGDVTSDEFWKLINPAPNKTCKSDPALTWLVKDMRGLLAPFLSMLFNKSLTADCFPSQFNEAVVRPLLKKSGLDVGEWKNYRPVSNLPFVSKLLDKVVQVRIQAFFDGNGLMPKMQSAYRQFHSTEKRQQRFQRPAVSTGRR